MTFHRAIDPAAGEEEPFGMDEVLFSRTDRRGVIRSANSAFQRVSGYSWDRLIGAPHRLIRDPDTPRATFSLMWTTIQHGRPFAAFLKNRSSSGKWYWVLATVVPVQDGYVSVHIKPRGTIFAKARALHAEIAEAEQTRKMAPEKSCGLMLLRLEEAGFRSYAEFSARALEEELSLRDAAMGRTTTAHSRALQAIMSNLTATHDQQALLLQEFDALQSIPTNMRIIASRLEPSGGPISAISDNYKYASAEISARLAAFAGNRSNLCRTMAEVVTEALLLDGVDRLVSELSGKLATEGPAHAALDPDRELESLAHIRRTCREKSRAAMLHADTIANEIYVASAEIRRMTLGLDTIRVMGRVESGRLGSTGVGLALMIDQLDALHGQIAQSLQRLMDLSAAITAGIHTYQRRQV